MADQSSDLVALIAQLEAERTELDVMIAGLRRRAGLAAADPIATGLPSGGSRDPNAGRDTSVIVGRVRPDEFFRLSISDAITKYLEIMKQPQNPTAIVNGLKSGGVLTNAKNFYANVNTELKRMKAKDVLVNTPSGWGLAEWYPRGTKQQVEPVKKKGKKKKAGAKSAAKAPARPKASALASSTPAVAADGLNWHQFLSARLKAGKSMQDASSEWKQRKAASA